MNVTEVIEWFQSPSSPVCEVVQYSPGSEQVESIEYTNVCVYIYIFFLFVLHYILT